MNYLFFHYGEHPKHLEVSINNVYKVDKNAKVIFASNVKPKFNLDIFFDINNLPELAPVSKKLIELFEGTPLESNPLWVTSLLRIYVLKEAAINLDLNEFVHFDNDVLIYKSFESINNQGVFSNQLINITSSDPRNLVFGYSYFPSKNLIVKLCEYLDKIIDNYQFYCDHHARGGTLNEMRVMAIARDIDKNLFYELPILPYENNEILFDPSSYGQYLNGSHVKRGNFIFKRRWTSLNHYIGRELMSKRITVAFKKKPYVKYENKKYELANLHVHSKNLKKFL